MHAKWALTQLGIAGCAILEEDWTALGGLPVYSASACAANYGWRLSPKQRMVPPSSLADKLGDCNLSRVGHNVEQVLAS